MQKSNRQHEDMDDLLFENRNKEYGAYFLRKRYNRLLVKALIITLSALLLLLLAPYVIDLFNHEPAMDVNSIQVEEMPVRVNDVPNLAPPSPPPPPENKRPEIAPIVIKDTTEKKHPETKDTSKFIAQTNPGKADSLSKGSNGVPEGTDSGKVYVSVQKLPSFPGGIDQMHVFLTNNIHYPKNEFAFNIPNKITINMIIEKDGSISHITVSQPAPKNIEIEAIRVVKMMPRWEPGREHDKPVRVFVRFAINFPKKN